ncbi:MAG: MscL family protein [Candidatus Bathyarchaeaceae archaeon]
MSKKDEMLEELRRIRELLEPKPAPPPSKGLWNEFMDFFSKYKVMGLAVAFIMGIYLGELIKALVADFIMPIIGLALPNVSDLKTYSVTLGAQIFGVGDFLVALITFVIVAFVIFLLVKITKKWGIE